jgi:hypothetical protein
MNSASDVNAAASCATARTMTHPPLTGQNGNDVLFLFWSQGRAVGQFEIRQGKLGMVTASLCSAAMVFPVEPSLLWRIWDYAVVLLVNWKGAVATVCLVVLTLPQLLPESKRATLDGTFSPEFRRRLLIAAAAVCLLVASFQAYDDVSTKNRALAQELASRAPSHRTITGWVSIHTEPQRQMTI